VWYHGRRDGHATWSVRTGLAAGLGVLAAAAVAITVAHALRTRGRPSRHGSAVAGRAARRPAPARTLTVRCPAPALGGRLPARVYLPAGYAAHGRALPVIYFLHGLPAGPTSYTRNSFVAGAIARAHMRAIVVAPQGARVPDSDPEYLDWSPTDDWPAAIAQQLTSCIDARFDAIRSRHGRALVGLSAGGYGALNIGLRNLATFGAVESWSGYPVATDPSGYHVLKLHGAAAAAARVPRGAPLRRELARFPSLIGFYVGRSDDRFAADNRSFDRALDTGHIAHVFRTYPGGHSAALWESQAPAWLGMALVYLASGRLVAP
jgi:enterochelin esterase-like enzyme